tara:strand:+ start:85 stop:309 length:225 start_codon:yes stop_codon:yes gene_type:complete
MGRKRIHQLDTLSNLEDDDFFAVDREISPGSYKTYKVTAETIHNYIDGITVAEALLLQNGDFVLLETGDKILLE